jgi:hypothetical protein
MDKNWQQKYLEERGSDGSVVLLDSQKVPKCRLERSRATSLSNMGRDRQYSHSHQTYACPYRF